MELKDLITIIIPISLGCLGYILSEFILRPILKYKDLRAEIHSTVVFYLNIIVNDIENSDTITPSSELRALATKIQGINQTITKMKLIRWIFNVPQYIKLKETSSNIIGLSNSLGPKGKHQAMQAHRSMTTYQRIEEIQNLIGLEIDSSAKNSVEMYKNEYETFRIRSQ